MISLGALIIAVLLFALACWLISWVPLPAGVPVQVRTFLYILALVVLVLYLLGYV